MKTDRYLVFGLSVFLLMLVVTLSTDDVVSGGMTGVVEDVEETENGYTFEFVTSEGSFRCFSSVVPVETGYYSIHGSFSDGGDMFFVSGMERIEH